MRLLRRRTIHRPAIHRVLSSLSILPKCPPSSNLINRPKLHAMSEAPVQFHCPYAQIDRRVPCHCGTLTVLQILLVWRSGIIARRGSAPNRIPWQIQYRRPSHGSIDGKCWDRIFWWDRECLNVSYFARWSVPFSDHFARKSFGRDFWNFKQN